MVGWYWHLVLHKRLGFDPWVIKEKVSLLTSMEKNNNDKIKLSDSYEELSPKS